MQTKCDFGLEPMMIEQVNNKTEEEKLQLKEFKERENIGEG